MSDTLKERAAVSSLVELIPKDIRYKGKDDKVKNGEGSHNIENRQIKTADNCIFHGWSTHNTAECMDFHKLTLKQKYEELRKKTDVLNALSHTQSQSAQPLHLNMVRLTIHHTLLFSKLEKRHWVLLFF